MNENTNVNGQANAEVTAEKTVEKVEKKKINPFLFLKPDELTEIKVMVVYDDTGKIESVLGDDFFYLKESLDVLKYSEFTFKFSSVNYEKINKYRQRCIEVDRTKNTQTVNNYKMRDFLIVYHLRSWDIKDENGNDVELKFDANNALADESIDKVYSLHPSIIDIVMTGLEKKLLLV